MSTTSSEGSVDTTGYGASGTQEGGTALSRGAITSRTAPQPQTSPSTGTKAKSVKPSSPTGSTTPTTTKAAARQTNRKRPRRVRLAVARIDPWSVMKMSFLISVALGIAGVILTAVLWMILSTMNVFNDVEGVLASLQTSTVNPFTIKEYIGFGRVVSLSIVIGVIDIILMTAIATVMAFLYNICSALVGGLQLTLTDD